MLVSHPCSSSRGSASHCQEVSEKTQSTEGVGKDGRGTSDSREIVFEVLSLGSWEEWACLEEPPLGLAQQEHAEEVEEADQAAEQV